MIRRRYLVTGTARQFSNPEMQRLARACEFATATCPEFFRFRWRAEHAAHFYNSSPIGEYVTFAVFDTHDLLPERLVRS